MAEDKEVAAKILCKTHGVLAGIPFANAIFQELNCSPNWLFKEGEFLEGSPTCEVAYVGGEARNILLAERVVLNVISRCSGVATQARRVKQMVDSIGWKGMIAGTRKTTPGFRVVEKYGLLIGGVKTHRFDLSNMIMIKDNHIALSGGSITRAMNAVKAVNDFVSKVEVECRDLNEAKEAADCGADIVMLDNFTQKEMHDTSRYLKKNYPSLLLEVSGGITPEDVLQFAIPSIDIISLSALVQGYPSVDFSMKVLKPQT